ncbi:MAG TPA: response regulator transcription factor [Bacillota bacterium]|nr:response regulator transcription factor [Bacillota bacterium]
MATKILLIEDDENIRDLLRMYLENEGFWVAEAASGTQGLEYLAKEDINMIILDIMIPGPDGWEVCKTIRETSTIPIIMVTARGEESERIMGLDLGADDYLVKPFSPKELLARIKAVFRRLEVSVRNREEELRKGKLTINHQARLVEVGNTSLSLTPKEFDLLYFFALNEHKVFSREELLANVWGHQFYDLRTVDTHVKQLREKITKAHDIPDYIKTVWGVGYKFEVVS